MQHLYSETNKMSKIIHFVFVFVLCIFWTVVATFGLLMAFIKNPTGYFKVKPRKNMPEVLTKGWKHSFVKLSVSS